MTLLYLNHTRWMPFLFLILWFYQVNNFISSRNKSNCLASYYARLRALMSLVSFIFANSLQFPIFRSFCWCLSLTKMFDGSKNHQSNFCPIQRKNIVTFATCLLPKGEAKCNVKCNAKCIAKCNANQDIGFPRLHNSEVKAHLFPK